jgi:hypothetical protein
MAVVAVAALAAWRPAAAAAPAAALVLAAAWRAPAAVLTIGAVAVLTVRPALDVFTERRFGMGPFNVSATVVFGLGILLVAAGVGWRRGRDGQRLWTDRGLLVAHVWLAAAYAIGLASALAGYGAAGAGVAVRECLRMASVVAAFLLVLWWTHGSPDRNARGWRFLIAGTVAPLAVALWQYVSGRGNLDLEGVNRLQGTFAHPNTLGPYLVPFVLLALAGVPGAGTAGRIARAAVAFGLSVVIALTYSRTALLILVAGLVALPLLQVGRFGVARVARWAAVAVAFAATAWLLVGDLVVARFTGIRFGIEAVEALRSGDVGNSFEWRLVTWAILLTMTLDHPLVGHGAGMTTELNPMVDRSTGIPFNAHNDFVRVVFENGLLGLVAYVIYGVLLCRWALSTARRAPEAHSASAYAVAAALLALFFLTGGVPEFGTQTAIQYQIYGMLALLTGVGPAPGVTAPETPATGERARAE